MVHTLFFPSACCLMEYFPMPNQSVHYLIISWLLLFPPSYTKQRCAVCCAKRIIWIMGTCCLQNYRSETIYIGVTSKSAKYLTWGQKRMGVRSCWNFCISTWRGWQVWLSDAATRLVESQLSKPRLHESRDSKVATESTRRDQMYEKWCTLLTIASF